MLIQSPTNQQFVILPNQTLKELGKKYAFEVWTKVDETHTAVRFCTSWSTSDTDVDALIADIQAL